MGYSAPEYIESGRLTSKCDVWSYGFFLYELITGSHPLERKGPQGEELIEWVKLYLDTKKFLVFIDSRLEGKYSLKSVQKLSFIANCCLSSEGKSRPKMSEVLKMVNQLMAFHHKKPVLHHLSRVRSSHSSESFLPQIFPSKLLKSCFKKYCCCVS